MVPVSSQRSTCSMGWDLINQPADSAARSLVCNEDGHPEACGFSAPVDTAGRM